MLDASRLLFSLLSLSPVFPWSSESLGPRFLVLPCAYPSAREAERGHKFAARADRWRGPRYPKCRADPMFSCSQRQQAIPPVPVAESVARRNQFCAQIPYLRARRNRRFELIVDEPSLVHALFFSPSVHPPSSIFASVHPSDRRNSDTRLRLVSEYIFRCWGNRAVRWNRSCTSNLSFNHI